VARTFTPPSTSGVVVKRADDPPPVDGPAPRELEEAGVLTPAKRHRRDASLARTRRAKVVGLLVAVPIALLGVRIAVTMPNRWGADAVAAIMTIAGIWIGRIVAERLGPR
jgi:hypothetical protein